MDNLAQRDDDDLETCQVVFIGAVLGLDGEILVTVTSGEEPDLMRPVYEVRITLAEQGPSVYAAVIARVDRWYSQRVPLVFCTSYTAGKKPSLSELDQSNIILGLPRTNYASQ